MEFLETALRVTGGGGGGGEGRLAIDLGCGAGNETLALLERGWRVHAVDGEPRAIEVLTRRVPAESAPRLTTQVSLFHQAELPKAHLVFASLSLPFAAEHFRESVEVAKRAVRVGGWFVGVLFGHHDTWAGEDQLATVDADDIESLFDDLEILEVEESEFDGPSGGGPKHWHWYLVTACRPV